MDIIISKNKGFFYEQIYNEIRRNIVQGILLPNDELPSTRGLARDLNVSVITTKRAYAELEKDDYIYSIPGKGYYVNEGALEYALETELDHLRKKLREVYAIAETANVRYETVEKILRALFEGKSDS